MRFGEVDGDEKICDRGDREPSRVRERMETDALTEEGTGEGSCSLSAISPSVHVDEGVRDDGRVHETGADGERVRGRAEIEEAVARS